MAQSSAPPKRPMAGSPPKASTWPFAAMAKPCQKRVSLHGCTGALGVRKAPNKWAWSWPATCRWWVGTTSCVAWWPGTRFMRSCPKTIRFCRVGCGSMDPTGALLGRASDVSRRFDEGHGCHGGHRRLPTRPGISTLILASAPRHSWTANIRGIARRKNRMRNCGRWVTTSLPISVWVAEA